MTKPDSSTTRNFIPRVLLGEGGVLFFVCLTGVNVVNFLYHVVISRLLEPASYGALAALLGVMLAVSVPASAFQVTITAEVASASRGELGLRRMLARTFLVGTGCMVATLAASPLLQPFLKLPSAGDLALLGGYICLTLVGIVPRAVLLGEMRFAAAGGAMLLGAALRLGVGALLVHSGFGLAGALAGSLAGEGVALIAALIAVEAHLRIRPDAEHLTIPPTEAGTAALAFGGLWLLLGVDTFLARHYLSTTASGTYAAAAIAGRSTLFVASAIALIAFPRFVASGGRSREARKVLVEAVSAVAVLGGALALGIALFARQVIETVFGRHYQGSVSVIGLLALGSAFAGIANLLIYYQLAARSRAALLAWPAALAAVLGIAVLHTSPAAVASVMVLTLVALLFGLIVAAFALPVENDPQSATDDLHLFDAADPTLELTIVVPYYNPGPTLRPHITSLADVLARVAPSSEMIAVADGCTDGSEHTIGDLGSGRLRSIVLPVNQGKGHALRVGLSAARGRYVGFIDADGDLDPALLGPFVELMRLYQPDIILGSKRHPLSEVEYPGVRRLYSWGYQQIVRLLFRLNVRDTQTGIKLGKREVFVNVLPRMLEKRFAFDLEMLVVARRLGYTRLFEAPVKLRRRFTSTISTKAVWGMLLDTLAIFYRLRLLRWYDAAPPADRAAGSRSTVSIDTPAS